MDGSLATGGDEVSQGAFCYHRSAPSAPSAPSAAIDLPPYRLSAIPPMLIPPTLLVRRRDEDLIRHC